VNPEATLEESQTSSVCFVKSNARTEPTNQSAWSRLITTRLLEDALAELDPGFEIKQMDDYTRRPVLFRLFKLHGSVNWGREVDIGFPANWNMTNPPSVLKYLIENATEQQITNRFAICHPSSMGLADGRTPVFPAIAIPIEKKHIFESPNYMIEELKSALPHVTKIIMIGWRATEAHFLHLLSQHLRRGVYLSIVGASQQDAEKIRVHIHDALRENPPNYAPETAAGFTVFMRSGRVPAILDS
jgi:hypothetical protein